MEIGESAAEGAIRETWEEANAEVEVISPFAQLDIPLIGQVRQKNLLTYLPFKLHVNLLKMLCILGFLEQTYIIFLAKLKKPNFSPGPESSECQLFALDDIPINSLAFSSMLVSLNLVRYCLSFKDMIHGEVTIRYISYVVVQYLSVSAVC